MSRVAPVAAAVSADVAAVLAQYAPIADLSAHGMAVSTPDGRFLLVNAAFCQLVGWSRDDLLGRRYQDITRPEDNFAAASVMARALANGDRGISIDKRYVGADGSDIHVRISGTIVRSPDGKVICYLTQVTDLTELRAAQEQSRLSEESASRVVQSAADAYISIDETGTIRDWNPAAVRMFGWQRDEALGVELAELLIPEEFRDAHRAGLARYSEPVKLPCSARLSTWSPSAATGYAYRSRCGSGRRPTLAALRSSTPSCATSPNETPRRPRRGDTAWSLPRSETQSSSPALTG